MEITGFDILLTFKCTAKCKHCSYRAGPEKNGFIKNEDIDRYLLELTETQPLQSITVHGGEPFLYLEQLIYTIKRAKELKIPRRGIITNSYWAKSYSIAERKLYKLKEAGLTQITFSADGFHQKYISVKRVKNAIASAKKIGFENLWVDSYFLGDFNTDNPFNKRTKSTLTDLKDLKGIKFNKYLMGFEGRGADLAEYVEKNVEIPAGKCPLPFWIGGDLTAPTTVEIDWEGNITLCPGICIGNTNYQSIGKILESYDYSTHPILSTLVRKGPIGLLELANEKNCNINQKFVNECHACYEMRKLLRSFYPQYLAPKNCYQD